MRKWLWILLFPLAAQAAGEGAWQASSIGLTLNHRGESISSRPLSAAEPVSGQMTLVAWIPSSITAFASSNCSSSWSASAKYR